MQSTSQSLQEQGHPACQGRISQDLVEGLGERACDEHDMHGPVGLLAATCQKLGVSLGQDWVVHTLDGDQWP
eukprot:11132134-Alexandrium_andersonii.AAC.1